MRRDLSQLERLKLLRRVHGGAVSMRSLTMLEAQLEDRDQDNAAEKERIARAAVASCPRAAAPCSSTPAAPPSGSPRCSPRPSAGPSITHAVPIAALLAPLAHVELHLLPGRVRTATQAAVGHATVTAIHELRADLAFVGTNGISVRHGLSTPDPEEAATKRAIVESAERVIALSDATKVGQERTIRFAALEDIDVLVTDDSIDATDVASFEAAGLEVLRA